VVGQNGPRQTHRVLGEGRRAIGMHETQGMIHEERPDGEGAEDAWGGGASSGHGRYASRVKVIFADASGSEETEGQRRRRQNTMAATGE